MIPSFWTALRLQGVQTPMTSYTATCTFCGATVIAAKTVGAEDVEPLAAHLREKHPREVVGVRTWRMNEVMRRYRLTAA